MSVYPITEEMLQPILDALIANLDVFVPGLIALFGLIVTIRVVPSLIADILRN